MTEADCSAIINYFDNSGEQRGRLRYDDFLQVVMPCDAPHLRALIAQRPNLPRPSHGYLAPKVEYELAKLLEMEIHFYRITEALK